MHDATASKVPGVNARENMHACAPIAGRHGIRNVCNHPVSPPFCDELWRFFLTRVLFPSESESFSIVSLSV